MDSFEWVDATSVEHAVALLGSVSEPGGPIVAKAGGIDLVDLMKEGVVRPARVVNLRSIEGLDRIAFDEGRGLSIDALVTLAQIESSLEIQRRYRALAEAARHAATPQVRNAATIGGNLLQRPRCWYFRNELFHGTREEVGREQSQYGAIFDNAKTTMVRCVSQADGARQL